MIQYLEYDTSTGRIEANGSADLLIDAQASLNSGKSILLHLQGSPDTQYVLGGSVVPRPVLAFDKTSIAADDTDTATLTGLPDPCTVSIDGTEYEVTGGTLEITSALPAIYQIEITDEAAFPAQAFSGVVEAVTGMLEAVAANGVEAPQSIALDTASVTEVVTGNAASSTQTAAVDGV